MKTGERIGFYLFLLYIFFTLHRVDMQVGDYCAYYGQNVVWQSSPLSSSISSSNTMLFFQIKISKSFWLTRRVVPMPLTKVFCWPAIWLYDYGCLPRTILREYASPVPCLAILSSTFSPCLLQRLFWSFWGLCHFFGDSTITSTQKLVSLLTSFS